MPKDLHEKSIDAVDRRILRVLQSDGRITNADLSQAVGLSPAACHARVKALETAGVIDRYVALLNPKTTGRSQTVFVHITLSSQTSKALSEFEHAVTRSSYIQQCHLMSGDDDYLLQVIVRNASEFEELHHDFLTCLPHVARVSSNFALRAVRRTTAIPLDE